MIRRALIQKSVNKYKLDEPGHGSFLTYLANENVNQNINIFPPGTFLYLGQHILF